MKVVMRNPRRSVELQGPLRVSAVLERLGVNPESVLVIRDDELVTGDVELGDAEEIELRPVISGGARAPLRASGRAAAPAGHEASR